MLAEASLRRTSARVTVLAALLESPAPQSHGELADALIAHRIDRATIYRNLVDLTEAELVERSDLGDHVWRFAVRRAGRSHKELHPHFVCVSCGEVSCLPEETVVLAPRRGSPRALASADLEVQLRGRCDTCA